MMINYTIITNGTTIIDKNITTIDVMKVTSLIMLVCFFTFSTGYESLIFKESIRAMKWVIH